MINTADIERLNATFRAHLAPLARRGRAPARHTLTRHEGMFVVARSITFAHPWRLSLHRRRRRPWRLESPTIAGQ